MANSAKDTAVARQVALFIRRLDCLSILPQVAAEFLAKLAKERVDSCGVAAIIESDPGLTAKIFSLAYNENVTFVEDNPSVSEAVSKLSMEKILEAFLSLKVFGVFETSRDFDGSGSDLRKQLIVHSLATACCAGDIAELSMSKNESQVAFSAGLLHDIGKFAIDEVMPRSFERIVEEAKSSRTSIISIEQKHLGLDHTMIGRRLAQQWYIPEKIAFAIWLHHCDTEAVSGNIWDGKIASIVRLADIISRQCNIGVSGSFDLPGSISGMMQSLSLSVEQIDQIRNRLGEEVAQRSLLLGLDNPNGAKAYCGLISKTAAKLSKDRCGILLEKKQLAANSANLDFISNFSRDLSANSSPIDTVSRLGVCWQKHYQTGSVCVYLLDDTSEDFVEVITVDNGGRTNSAVLNVPEGTEVIPACVKNNFAIINAGEHIEWLLGQTGLDLDISQTILVPLLAAGRAVGAIVFEQRLPIDTMCQTALFSVSTSIAAGIIALAQGTGRNSALAEEFVYVLDRLSLTQSELASVQSLVGLAEMAAGAGHELNNPLAVISGRAQMLCDSEEDGEKKQILKQIQTRADEISQIVVDLMSFARPEKPVPQVISLKSLLDYAVDEAKKRGKLRQTEITFNEIDNLGDVYVDAAHATIAIANLISNGLESYGGDSGPIEINGLCEQPLGFVSFEIIDKGCGMSAETLSKAAGPFFSAKPAGRQRGMGLAHAKRYLNLNNGSIYISSKPNEGTTVTISLPKGN